MIQAIGIDPGLVDTGIVSLTIREQRRALEVHSAVVKGTDVPEIKRVVDEMRAYNKNALIFVEDYRARSHWKEDTQMLNAVAAVTSALPGSKKLPNTGIKTLIKPVVLEVFGLRRFPHTTNHQDLLSAARILMLGLYKDPDINTLLASIVKDDLNGHPWTVI